MIVWTSVAVPVAAPTPWPGRGLKVVGLDIAARFVALAPRPRRPPGAAFVQADARQLPLRPGRFDAAISLCQGGFGLLGGPGQPPRRGRPRARGHGRLLRPGGRLVVSAFSAYFQLRFLEDGDAFDAERGVNHERTEVRDEAGRAAPAELWTTCFTPRELRLLARQAGLDPAACGR